MSILKWLYDSRCCENGFFGQQHDCRKGKPNPEARPRERFFMDHGTIHDSHTGRHVFGEDRPNPKFEALELLNSMHSAYLKVCAERDELLKFREKWEMFDGNSPGYNRDKARNYGRQAAELKSQVERLRAALGKILKCTHGLHDEDEIARNALEGK